MVIWTNEDGTTIEWPDSLTAPIQSLTGHRAIRVSAPLTGHAQHLEAGAEGQLTFDHPTDYSSPARVRELTKSHGSFGATFVAIIEFE